MIIAVDMDSVLNNLQEYAIKTYNRLYNTCYTMEDFTDYDVCNILGMDGGAKMREIYADPETYSQLSPIPKSQNVMQKWVNAGHQVYVVTDAVPLTLHNKVNWLKHYYPFIDEAHIVSMKHKWLFKCDVMVDDNIDNLINGHHYDRVCLNYPWNKNIKDEVYDIYRCFNWDDVSIAVDDINRKYKELMKD